MSRRIRIEETEAFGDSRLAGAAPTTSLGGGLSFETITSGTFYARSSSPSSSGKPVRRQRHNSRKKPPNHVPRPSNAFFLYRSSFIKSRQVTEEVETDHSTLSKIAGLAWKQLPPDEREMWQEKAKQVGRQHKIDYPDYSFRPVYTKPKGQPEKRKVRETGRKDPVRLAKIAELVAEGKSDREVREAMAEFDKHHIPEFVARFDEPLTAEGFEAAMQEEEHRSSLTPPPRKRLRRDQSGEPAAQRITPVPPAQDAEDIISAASERPSFQGSADQSSLDLDFSSYGKFSTSEAFAGNYTNQSLDLGTRDPPAQPPMLDTALDWSHLHDPSYDSPSNAYEETFTSPASISSSQSFEDLLATPSTTASFDYPPSSRSFEDLTQLCSNAGYHAEVESSPYADYTIPASIIYAPHPTYAQSSYQLLAAADDSDDFSRLISSLSHAPVSYL